MKKCVLSVKTLRMILIVIAALAIGAHKKECRATGIQSTDGTQSTRASQNLAMISDSEVRAFVSNWLKLSEINDNFDAIMDMYANNVFLYKFGNVNKNFIAKDKMKYFNRWPHRVYTLDAITLQPASTNYGKIAEVTFQYKISNGKKKLQGKVTTRLVIRKQKDKLFIVSEKAGKKNVAGSKKVSRESLTFQSRQKGTGKSQPRVSMGEAETDHNISLDNLVDEANAVTAGPIGLFFRGKRVVGQKNFPRKSVLIGIGAEPGWHIWAKIFFNEEETFTLNYKFGDANFAKLAGLEVYPPSRKTFSTTNDFQWISISPPQTILPADYKTNTMTIRIKGFIVYPDKRVDKFDSKTEEAGDTTCKGSNCKCINIKFQLPDSCDSRHVNISGCG